MTAIINKMQFAFSIVAGIVLNGLGGCDVLLGTLVLFASIDYISGIAVAAKEKTVSSKTGFKGLVKKAMMFAIIAMAAQIDFATGGEMFRNITLLFYISNEGISVLENTSKLGIKYPKKIKDVLEQLMENEDD